VKIYTRTGDDGSTGLVGGARIRKDDLRIEAIGAVDELNSALGLVLCTDTPPAIAETLLETQSRLFDLGAELANPSDPRFDLAVISTSHAESLESSIDLLTSELEPLRNFVLPGGTESAARLHHARTICRRAERAILRVAPPVRSEVAAYINRLSDWLFVAARTCNASSDVEDIKWTSSQK
jgi:cob(I)alamin adenosyltransferase